MAERIQRKRTKGWRKPKGAVYVGRKSANNVGKWGNPFIEGTLLTNVTTWSWWKLWWKSEIGKQLISTYWNNRKHRLTTAECVSLYREYILSRIEHNGDYYTIEDLRGKDLMCWCALDQPCHADVLLEIANG